jgi:hypothetical protein
MALKVVQFFAVILTALALVPAGAHFFELPIRSDPIGATLAWWLSPAYDPPVRSGAGRSRQAGHRPMEPIYGNLTPPGRRADLKVRSQLL